jgi:hypothetical protein
MLSSGAHEKDLHVRGWGELPGCPELLGGAAAPKAFGGTADVPAPGRFCSSTRGKVTAGRPPSPMAMARQRSLALPILSIDTLSGFQGAAGDAEAVLQFEAAANLRFTGRWKVA